jgi:UDP-N-acetylmuramate dehydrogenase
MTTAVDDAAAILGERARRDHPLGPMTTYRVGGAAALFLAAEGEDDLALARAAVSSTGIPVLVVGRGSNLLVADAGFPGLAISLGEAFGAIDIDGTRVRAGGAVALPVLARKTAAAGLTGLEWAVGVPGSVGGAVRMNAGGHGSDMAAVLQRVRVIDLRRGEDVWVPVASLALGYRRSAVAPNQVVVAAELGLQPGVRATGEATLAEIVRWRRDNQPGGQNAGSVFTNPPGDSAGRLIDAAGAKGLRIGTAQVSPKHANFIIADPGGRADDVVAVMRAVRQRVLDDAGVLLEVETRLVGCTLDPRSEVEG